MARDRSHAGCTYPSKGSNGSCITGPPRTIASRLPSTQMQTIQGPAIAQRIRPNRVARPPLLPASNVRPHPPTSPSPLTEPPSAASTHPTSLLPIGIKAPRLLIRAYLWVVQQMPSLDPKDLLPIGLSATKGAIICGNASTPSLLVVEFRTAQGSFGIVRARSKLDFYKQILSFRFGGALVRYVENEELQGPMTATGQLVQEYILASKCVAAILPRVWTLADAAAVADTQHSNAPPTSPTAASSSSGAASSSTLSLPPADAQSPPPRGAPPKRPRTNRPWAPSRGPSNTLSSARSLKHRCSRCRTTPTSSAASLWTTAAAQRGSSRSISGTGTSRPSGAWMWW